MLFYSWSTRYHWSFCTTIWWKTKNFYPRCPPKQKRKLNIRLCILEQTTEKGSCEPSSMTFRKAGALCFDGTFSRLCWCFSLMHTVTFLTGQASFFALVTRIRRWKMQNKKKWSVFNAVFIKTKLVVQGINLNTFNISSSFMTCCPIYWLRKQTKIRFRDFWELPL